MPKTTRQKKIARRTQKVKRLPRGPRGGIELLLIQGVENLGQPGDVVEVRPGYANNYLLPQGLATIANDHHKRMVEKHRERLQEIQKARMASMRQFADSIGRQSVTIEANANDDGNLYGSVGPAEIATALKAHDFNIAADQIRLEGPLKELGLYTVRVHVGHEIDAELKVWVVPAVQDGSSEDSAESAS